VNQDETTSESTATTDDARTSSLFTTTATTSVNTEVTEELSTTSISISSTIVTTTEETTNEGSTAPSDGLSESEPGNATKSRHRRSANDVEDLCPWIYTYNRKHLRTPEYILKAKCKDDLCMSRCTARGGRYETVDYVINSLEKRHNKTSDEYYDIKSKEIVPVACRCKLPPL
jgi:hypothetical protein